MSADAYYLACVKRARGVRMPRDARSPGLRTDVPSPHGTTTLIWAAGRNRCGDIEILVARGGANIDLEHAAAFVAGFFPLRATPLIMAAAVGAVEAVRKLVELGATVDLPLAGRGTTALWWACFAGNVQCAEFLLGRGASPTVMDSRDRLSPMHVAARGNHVGIIRLLAAKGAPVDGKVTSLVWLAGATALFLASPRHRAVVRALLELRASPEAEVGPARRTPLGEAVRADRRSIVELLLRAGANPNTYDTRPPFDSPLLLAVKAGNPRLARLLLRFGADPNQQGPAKAPPLVVAAVNRNDSTMVTLLLGEGADANTHHPLVQAALCGHHRVTKVLLGSGADVCLPDTAGLTALTAAVQSGSFPVVQLCVMHGASIAAPARRAQLVAQTRRFNAAHAMEAWFGVAKDYDTCMHVAASRSHKTGPLLLRMGKLRLTPRSWAAKRLARSTNPWAPQWMDEVCPETVRFVDQVLAGWVPCRHRDYSDAVQTTIHTLLLVECRLLARGKMHAPPELWRLIATVYAMVA